MTKTAIVTGITGQDGPYLAEFLLNKGYKVYGIAKRYSNPNYENLRFLNIHNRVELITGDVTDSSSMGQIVKSIRPDEFYNLAAQSFVGSSWDLNHLTTEVNSIGVINILTALKMHSPHTKFYQASTSELYGNVNSSRQNEQTPFHPRSPYGISKLHAYWTTVNFRDSYGMFTANGILFNHESPLRGIEFVSRKITNAVAQIKLGLATNVRLGNLDAKRDWGFAGDYVEAMWLIMQQPEPDDFVISTGTTRSIREFLDIAFEHVGITDWTSYVEIDPRFNRPAEVNLLCGDSTKARQVLGWSPRMTFNDMVKNMVDSDIQRLSK
jgi:GDPmannose 4,6-dehydratase